MRIKLSFSCLKNLLSIKICKKILIEDAKRLKLNYWWMQSVFYLQKSCILNITLLKKIWSLNSYYNFTLIHVISQILLRVRKNKK